MPRILAIEWDSREARFVDANVREGEVSLRGLGRVSFPASDTELNPEQVSKAISEGLSAQGISRNANAIVGVGRASIELKQLTLPPVPDEDLPEMVRFQALREFTSIDDSSAVDFSNLTTDPNAPRQVLAAAISSDLMRHLQEVCKNTKLPPLRVVLRGSSLAALVRHQTPSGSVRMVLDLLSQEADVVVTVADRVSYLRTFRLPDDPLTSESAGRILLSEIRRTLVACQSQLGGRRVESILVSGNSPEHQALAARIEKELDQTVALFDPFERFNLGTVATSLPEAQLARFAPLMGMLLEESLEQRPDFDFLNPRKRPLPESKRNRYATVALAVAAVVALAVGAIYWRLGRLDAEIDSLSQTSKEKDALVQQGQGVEKSVAAVDDWNRHNTVWLDEMSRLATVMPPSEDVMLSEVRMGPNAAGGEVELVGRVKDVNAVDQVEAALRDKTHRIEGKTRKFDTKQPPYGWTFRSRLIVEAPGGAKKSTQKSARNKR